MRLEAQEPLPIAQTVAEPLPLVTPGGLSNEFTSFVRRLRRENVSPNTFATYSTAVRRFADFLQERGYPTDVRGVTAHHVEEWQIELLEQWKPATAHNRFRGLQRFFGWYAEREDDFRSPMLKTRPPHLPEYQPRILALDELRAVLAASADRAFEASGTRHWCGSSSTPGHVGMRSRTCATPLLIATWIWTAARCGCSARAAASGSLG